MAKSNGHSSPLSAAELLAASRLPGAKTSRGPFSVVGALLLLLVCSVAGGLIVATLAIPGTLVAAGTTQNAINWWDELPANLKEVNLPQRTVLLDRNGDKIGQLYSENRVIVPLKRMGVNVQNALIATEDSRFYQHQGLDARGVSRAIVNNVFGDSTQGASTLTQQLVENIRTYEAKNAKARAEAKAQTPADKLEELRYATGIEETSSKKDILEAYLNIVYFGNGAYGIEAAAQRYFSVSAKKLTVPQAATLVALLKSPSGYDPFTRPQDSRLRRDVVMKRMVEEEYISNRDYRNFSKKKTALDPTVPDRGCGVSKYPYYCQLLVNKFLESPSFGANERQRQRFLDQGGLTITTALAPKAMDEAQAAVDTALGRNNRVAAGLAMVQPGTGQVLAISQNRTWGAPAEGMFDKTEIVYADTPAFQPGSTFKPITAAAAIEEGYPSSTALNSPSPAYFNDFDSPPGGFKNDNRSGYGVINMATALKFSVNTYFVALTEQVGVQDVAAMARRLGMDSMPDNLTGREGSITLGAYETSPLQLANVYATLGGRGVACDPVVMLKAVKNETGEEIPVPDGDCRQEISPAVADSVSEILQAPFTAGGTAQKLAIGRKATGKTGTTNDAAATWFSGYTPQAATSVWIGDPRGGQTYPLSGVYAYGDYYADVYGGTIAGPIWEEVMRNYHVGMPERWYPKPGGVAASMTARIVPDVVGVDVNSAVTLLLESGFTVNIAQKTGRLPNISTPNYVAAQNPLAGGKAAYGDEITLRLTTGSDTKLRVPSTYDELLLWQERAEQSADAPKE